MAFEIGQQQFHMIGVWADPRQAVVIVGALLALFGARLYRIAVVAPGFALGVLAVVHGAERFAPGVASPAGLLIAAICLGIVGGAICWFLERLAVMAAGGLIAGGLAHAMAPLAMGAAVPWYVPVAASLLGLLLFPKVYRALLPLLTPIIGALCIAWGLQRPDDLLLIGGVSVVGMLVQVIWSGGRKKDGGRRKDRD